MRLKLAPPSDEKERHYVDNYRALIRERYVSDFEFVTFERSPWTPLRVPVRQARVALVATVGAHRRQDAPFDTLSPDGDTSFRRIPDTCTADDLTLSHDGYDTEGCMPDINCVFPLDRLHELAAEGIIGGTAPAHYSCMGYIPHARPLLEETAPEVAREMVAAGVHAAVCVPT
jgi:D-proline reductase (dithiol) PrdB